MGALIEVVGLACDYCNARVSFDSSSDPANERLRKPLMEGWTMGIWDDDGEKTIVPIDTERFNDDPVALVACPKEACQKAIRAPEEVPDESTEEVLR